MRVFSESEINHRSGSIEIICGSMFSGKTEEMFRRIKRAQIAKQDVKLFKPDTDKRYSNSDIVSHDKNMLPCNIIKQSDTLLQKSGNARVICIDEAQFFDDGLIDVCQELAKRGKRIIIAGLDMDFKGIPFGPIPGLCAIADHITKLHAICVRCGSLAQFSHRKGSSNSRILLGQKEIYEPLCRSCYIASSE